MTAQTKKLIPAILVGAILAPGNAAAHLVNTNMGEFYAGMIHPLTSLEHLLPILALGVWASRSGTRISRWVVLAFPLALMAAITVGGRYPPLGGMQMLNLLALIILGATAWVDRWGPASVVVLAAIVIGLILGYRSGTDMAASTVGYRFLPGVGLTGFLVVTFVAAWFPSLSVGLNRGVIRAFGAVIIAVGVYLLVDLLLKEQGAGAKIAAFPTEESLLDVVRRPELRFPVIFGAVLAMTGWGAAHAITPGHGKALVAAYLVGSRSSAIQAVLLGLIVTATHTLGVFSLGLLSLFASQFWSTERLFPWIEMASGILVLGIGIGLFIRFMKGRRDGTHSSVDHHHHEHSVDGDGTETPHHHSGHGHIHSHTHLPTAAADGSISWKSMVGLGIAGGLLPCPSALVLLLTAISLQRIGFGLVLVFAFSLGLAGVLTVVGLLFVKGKAAVESNPRVVAIGRLLPMVSSLIIALIGAGIVAKAVYGIV